MPYPDIFDSIAFPTANICIDTDGTISINAGNTININKVDIPLADKTVVMDANIVIQGDLIVVGNIYSGFKFPMSIENKGRCIKYFKELYNLESGIDFYIVPDGIVVKIQEKERYKQLIAEALI